MSFHPPESIEGVKNLGGAVASEEGYGKWNTEPSKLATCFRLCVT